jgi:hypothetical protein
MSLLQTDCRLEIAEVDYSYICSYYGSSLFPTMSPVNNIEEYQTENVFRDSSSSVPPALPWNHVEHYRKCLKIFSMEVK